MNQPYLAPAEPAFVGNLAFAAALLLLVYFLHLGHVLKLHERDTWWASNGRDAVNALAVVTLMGAITLQGFAPPLALLFAATLTLALTVLQDAAAPRLRHPALVVLAAAVAAGALLLSAPAAMADGATRLLAWAFEGTGSPPP